MPADRLLVLLGGAAAAVFGLLVFVLAATDGTAFDRTPTFGSGGAVVALVIALLFGMLLLHAAVVMGARPGEGAALAFAFSLILLVFGGAGGMIGGILGIVGAGFALARNLRFTD